MVSAAASSGDQGVIAERDGHQNYPTIKELNCRLSGTKTIPFGAGRSFPTSAWPEAGGFRCQQPTAAAMVGGYVVAWILAHQALGRIRADCRSADCSTRTRLDAPPQRAIRSFNRALNIQTQVEAAYSSYFA